MLYNQLAEQKLLRLKDSACEHLFTDEIIEESQKGFTGRTSITFVSCPVELSNLVGLQMKRSWNQSCAQILSKMSKIGFIPFWVQGLCSSLFNLSPQPPRSQGLKNYCVAPVLLGMFIFVVLVFFCVFFDLVAKQTCL